MISERSIAKKFPSIWRETLPLLTPHFMHLFNESYVTQMEAKHNGRDRTVVVSSEICRMDLVAELAIQCVKMARFESVDIDEVMVKRELLEKAWMVSQSLIDKYEGRRPTKEYNLTEEERISAHTIAINIHDFISKYDNNVVFSPIVPGNGVIATCEADLSIGRTLFEIKTVNRKFQSKDIRQLFIYLGLQASSGRHKWIQAGLFNPRLAIWCVFDVETFVRLISGGRSLQEAFSELMSGLSRDVQIDYRF